MAYRVREIPQEVLPALVLAHNELVALSVGSYFHADVTSRTTSVDYKAPTKSAYTVAGANSTNTATAITLVNECKRVYNNHAVDDYAHNTAVSAVVSTADATTLATAITLVEALFTAFGTHRTASNVHFNNDSTNTRSSATAEDESTLVAAVNEFKTDVNAHIASAPAAAMVRMIPA